MKGFVIIDVPECCGKCRLRHMGMAYCNVAGRSTSHTNTGKPLDETVRPKFCPIIEEKENAEKTVISFCDAMGWKEERREMKQKEITFEDLVIAAERATRKAAAIEAAKKAMSGIAWAEPDVLKAVVLLENAADDLEAQIGMIQDSLIAEKKGGRDNVMLQPGLQSAT